MYNHIENLQYGGTLPCRSAGLNAPIKPRVLSPNILENVTILPPKEMEDLIHLSGPLTEDAVMKTMQARFENGKYFVS